MVDMGAEHSVVTQLVLFSISIQLLLGLQGTKSARLVWMVWLDDAILGVMK
jgi:hypothetical protein